MYQIDVKDTGKRGFIYCDKTPFQGNLKFNTGVFLTFLISYFSFTWRDISKKLLLLKQSENNLRLRVSGLVLSQPTTAADCVNRHHSWKTLSSIGLFSNPAFIVEKVKDFFSDLDIGRSKCLKSRKTPMFSQTNILVLQAANTPSSSIFYFQIARGSS